MLGEYGVTCSELAKRLGIDGARIARIIREETGIVPEMALLLGQCFHSPEYWAYSQMIYELVTTKNRLQAARPLSSIRPFPKVRDVSTPSVFDQCVCGHWGWQHIDFPDGGCIEIKDDSTRCPCPLYLRLGGYIETRAAEQREKQRHEEDDGNVLP